VRFFDRDVMVRMLEMPAIGACDDADEAIEPPVDLMQLRVGGADSRAAVNEGRGERFRATVRAAGRRAAAGAPAPTMPPEG